MNDNLIYNPKPRLLTVFTLIVFFFTAILFKFLYVQVISSKKLQARARSSGTEICRLSQGGAEFTTETE